LVAGFFAAFFAAAIYESTSCHISLLN
jgi:hypothetical protein